jgi:hypothetical protein
MLNFLALFTAISISGVAAYYSIYGLTAIFSGVFWPIVIMGSVLEVGKIVTTVWLHTHWHQLRWLLKSYMSMAVIVLMFITSMGIFGFLSKAHIEVTSQAGGGDLLIQQVDQNIAIEQRRIEDARKVMAQMDDAVTALLKGSGANAERDNNRTANMTTQATKLRESQKKERDSLNASIDAANTRIADLSRQKLKLNQEQLKMEAEVGPIKYIAQLIYDDSASKDMMERAVRWVIIVIVAVFDPLAVAMVLGVTMVMTGRRQEQAELQAQAEAHIHQEPVILEKEVIREVPVEVEKIVLQHDPELLARAETAEQELALALALLEEEKLKENQVIDNTDYKTITDLTAALDHMHAELERKDRLILQIKAEAEVLQEEMAGADASEFLGEVHTSLLDDRFPDTASPGQLFINTKQPHKLFKYTGTEFIEVDKNVNTSYVHDEHWQHWILGRLSRAELEWEDMTTSEQTVLEENLKHGK